MTTDPSMLILVVDQNKAMIRIVRSLLKQIDFENVDDASNGTEALSKLKERPHGLAICDLNTDLMSGGDLSKNVRVDEVLKNLPFIMMTDQTGGEDINAAKSAGLGTYIIKPFNAQTLKTKIEKEMQNRRRLVRRRVVRGGQLAFDNGARIVECLIRDISRVVHGFKCPTPRAFSTELVLHFDDGGAPRPCLVRWRQINTLGVEFTDAERG